MSSNVSGNRVSLPLASWLGIAGFVAVCAAACAVSQLHPVTDASWYGIVPPLMAVTAALLTGRILPSLLAAVLAGGWLAAWQDSANLTATVPGGMVHSGRFFHDAVSASEPLLILLYVLLIMTAIAVVLVGGGLQGVADWLTRFAQGRRSTQFVTFLAGLVIFIDDYANTMIVGSTMRPVTDRQRISREKLAFLVDATAAPIAGIALISTWIGYEVTQLEGVARTLGINEAGYAMFFDAIPFRFYCITMIAFVAINAASGVDFGPMAAAERRAARDGKVLGDGQRPISLGMTRAEPSTSACIHAATAVIPMAVMLGVFLGSMWISGGGREAFAADRWAPLQLTVWRDVFSQADSIPLLAWSSGLGLVAAVSCSLIAQVPGGEICRALWLGTKAAMMPVSVLILAWALKEACSELRTGDFLAAQLSGAVVPWVFPVLVFLAAGATAFTTGTSWGTMAILIPTAIPVAFAMDGNAYGPITILCIAAVLDGSIFGDHCSPISDTTIMSSAASGCDHVAHVRTQLPYSLTVAALAMTLGYLPAGLGRGPWAGILGGAAVSAILFVALAMGKRRAGE